MKTGIEITFNKSFDEKLDPEKCNKAMSKAMKEELIDLDRELRDEVPVITGYLRDSHSYDVSESKTVVTGYNRNKAPYMPYVLLGTSRMDGNNWPQRALNNVQATSSLANYFKMFYGALK